MARSRNIKPGFFLNDALAEKNCPLGRLLFIGLWSLADYKGDLEWRAGKIKAQLLPYDSCDVNSLGASLDKSGFIRFYSDGNTIFVNIVNFTKHQNPHINEKKAGSDIPAYSESMRQLVDLNKVTICTDKICASTEQDGTNPADSLLLIPDSLLPDPSSGETKVSPERKRFKPPTLQEVDSYMQEINKGSFDEANKFFDFYESKGWIVGKAKMKDWKAAVRNWTKNNFGGFNSGNQISSGSNLNNGQRLQLWAANATEQFKQQLAELEQQEGSGNIGNGD